MLLLAPSTQFNKKQPSPAVEVVLVKKVAPWGRPCRFCAHTDAEIDIVNAEEFWAWGYAPKLVALVLRNQGFCSFYCMRVFESRFEQRSWSMKFLQDRMAADISVHKEFHTYATRSDLIRSQTEIELLEARLELLKLELLEARA